MSRKRKKRKQNHPESRRKTPFSAQPHVSKGESKPNSDHSNHNSGEPSKLSHPMERPQGLTPQGSPEAYATDRKQQSHPNKADWIMAWATIGILFATCVNVGVAYWQWTSMDAGLIENRKSADAAKLSADATKVAADAGTASIQAWIVPDTWDYGGTERDRIIFKLGFKNIGKTVALDVGFTATFRFFEGTEITQIPAYQPYQCPEIRARPGIVPPDGVTHNTVRSEPYSVAQLEMLAEKKAYIFIHGCAVYRDIISNREHITETATIYTGGAKPSIFVAEKPSPFTIYAPYNRMK